MTAPSTARTAHLRFFGVVALAAAACITGCEPPGGIGGGAGG
jgi:hypothetical protein